MYFGLERPRSRVFGVDEMLPKRPRIQGARCKGYSVKCLMTLQKQGVLTGSCINVTPYICREVYSSALNDQH